jgi:hypothetical protein
MCSLKRTGAGLGHDRSKRGFADFERIAPQIVAVQLNQVEGVEEYLVVSAVVPDEIERGNAVVIASDSFAVDDDGAWFQSNPKILFWGQKPENIFVTELS